MVLNTFFSSLQFNPLAFFTAEADNLSSLALLLVFEWNSS